MPDASARRTGAGKVARLTLDKSAAGRDHTESKSHAAVHRARSDRKRSFQAIGHIHVGL
jgi:hypothetical protein